MIGGIYENRSGKGSRWVVRFKGITRRFNDCRQAERFLTGLRFKHDEGSFDVRDYRKDQPLGFENLALQWLELRRKDMLSYRASAGHMSYAVAYFGNRNIKDIDYPELEDFFSAKNLEHLSDKSRFNVMTTLRSFWGWVVKRNRKAQLPLPMPEFPEIRYKMAYRKTLTLEEQDLVLEEIRAVEPAREWVACLILATYPKIRPGELRKVKEKDVDLTYGIIRIRHSKVRGEYKEVKLLDEHTALLKALPWGFPEQYWGRHDDGKYKAIRWGENYLNREVWKPACKRAGVPLVPLYPGTKHTTIRGIRSHLRPDEIQKGAGIKTGSAFGRYFMTEYEDELKLYETRQRLRQGDTKVIRLSDHPNKSQLPENT